jgi:hypothetical protein
MTPIIELSMVMLATAMIVIGRYVMFGIVDIVFLMIALCGVNACWGRYFNEKRENNE